MPETIEDAVRAIADYLDRTLLCPPPEAGLPQYCNTEECQKCWMAALQRALGKDEQTCRQ